MKVKHCSCPGPRYSNLVDLCGTQEWGVFIIRMIVRDTEVSVPLSLDLENPVVFTRVQPHSKVKNS